jgi:hypothetical protein
MWEVETGGPVLSVPNATCLDRIFLLSAVTAGGIPELLLPLSRGVIPHLMENEISGEAHDPVQ